MFYSSSFNSVVYQKQKQYDKSLQFQEEWQTLSYMLLGEKKYPQVIQHRFEKGRKNKLSFMECMYCLTDWVLRMMVGLKIMSIWF